MKRSVEHRESDAAIRQKVAGWEQNAGGEVIDTDVLWQRLQDMPAMRPNKGPRFMVLYKWVAMFIVILGAWALWHGVVGSRDKAAATLVTGTKAKAVTPVPSQLPAAAAPEAATHLSVIAQPTRLVPARAHARATDNTREVLLTMDAPSTAGLYARAAEQGMDDNELDNDLIVY